MKLMEFIFVIKPIRILQISTEGNRIYIPDAWQRQAAIYIPAINIC